MREGVAAALAARRDVAEVAGSSMEPTLPHGCRIRIESGVPAVPGDVVLLETAHGLLIHRLVRCSGDLLFHAGDAGGSVGVVRGEALRGVGRWVLGQGGAAGHPIAPAPADVLARARRRAALFELVHRLASPLRTLVPAPLRRTLAHRAERLLG